LFKYYSMSEFFAQLESCNFWGGHVHDTGIPRQRYLDRLKAFLGNRLTKVLVGQRRSGKSVILRQIITGLLAQGVDPRNIFYLDKERLEFAELTDFQQLDELIGTYLKELAVRGKVYLFLDEVQEIAGWERVVNAYSQDSRRPYEVFVTGSNSHMLASELGTLLSGRYVPFEVFPFSFAEYAEAHGVARDKAAFIDFLQSGGLPELLHLTTDETRRHYVKALRDSIILNDIVRRHGIKNVDLLERLFLFACNNVGSLFSPNKVVHFLKSRGEKTNFETVTAYLSYLRKAFLIHECERFDIRGKEILSGNRKYYLNDIAFRHYLTSSFEPGWSRRLENIVYLHFRSRGYSVHVGTSRNLEVDFVIEKDGSVEYWQVCYLLSDESIIDREFRSLESIQDNYPKFVVSMDDISFGERKGIRHQRIWDVLASP